MKNENFQRTAAAIAGFFLLVSCSAKDQAETVEPAAAPASHDMHTSDEVKDDRVSISLTAEERLHVLFEMQGLLEATQGIIENLADDDMAGVQAAAAPAGLHAPGTVELRLANKLPQPFREIGKETHMAFDTISEMAGEGKPAAEIQRYLAHKMNNCVACHSMYKLSSE